MTERQGVSASPRGAAAATGAKWGRRASMDPFAPGHDRGSTPGEDDTVKENTAPANSTTRTKRTSHGIVMTPTMVRRRKSTGGRDHNGATSSRSAVAVVNVITKQNAKSTATGNARANAMTATLLGKRSRGPSPTRQWTKHFNANKMARLSNENETNKTNEEEDDDEDDEPNTQRTLFANDTDALDDDGVPRNVLLVNDFERTAELAFGAVAVGERKSLLLTMQNPSHVGNARVKYEGYSMATATREHQAAQTVDARFKCDLHVCTVPADRKVTLRITFEPKEQDINQELVAMLRFTVNDRFRLQCEVSGSGVAAVGVKAGSLKERLAMAKSRMSLDSHWRGEGARLSKTPSKEEKVVTYPIESMVSSGIKRRESVALVVSPPRHRKTKKMRVEEDEVKNTTSSGDNTIANAGTGGFQGSWWEKRKTLSDEEWMQRQEEGFTKWMNFVLVDSLGEENEAEANATAVIMEHPHRTSATPRGGRKRRMSRRIDFSSLRVLAMKRMESMWSRAAMEIYRSDAVTEAAANLKNEIADGKLVVRRDRPAYADVGLQAELIELLNNYHPVWLCLALETVLGHRVMASEKCSLRSVMTYCATVAEKKTSSKKGSTMPRPLRHVILHHLVHDPYVAKHHRLVKNLKTPVEGGSTLRAGKANPKISGRHYFDALMDSFVFKFFMVVLLLDRAATHRVDKFARFPCLFRVQQPVKKASIATDEDTKHVKHSQGMVTEFCRLFLSKEGRIDKHMKQLGYAVNFQQVPLDEVDLEITNLAVDLRDGVRLAKLLETLTAVTPSSTSSKSLASFLRVPALSRLQKIHNVEICLHFLQEKCGRDFLESIRTSSVHAKKAGRMSFPTLRDKEDAKLVETMAKAVVDGHRERTLALLWKLISVFQLRSLVNVERLSKEIDNIKQRMSFRALEFYEASTTKTKLGGGGSPSEEQNQGLDEAVRDLLLEWCRVVCANYFVRVADFSESFADGRALCYLLHYYHPMLLTKSEIRLTTAEYASSSTRAIHSASDLTKALENERRHFALANERVKQLGEVPVLLPEQYDSMNPPDEKVIVTFVCYLQSRLMDSSREIHAAARLKRWWRSPRVRLLMRRKKNQAARMIQRFWYTSSVKRLAIRRCRRLLQAGRLVAAYMCAWFDRSRFLRLRRAVVALQRSFRGRIQGSSPTIAKLVAAVKLQRTWRRHALRQSVQVSIRKRNVCKRIVRHMSASRIKHLLKANVEQKVEQREAKRVYQDMLETQRFEAGKKILLKKVHARCARVVRSAVKSFIVHRRQSKCATKMQTSWRRFMYQQRYLRQRNAVQCLQAAVRRWIQRRQDEAMERFRAMLAEQDREKKCKVLRTKIERRSALRILQSWRSFVMQKRFDAATKVQSLYRGVRAKKVLDHMKYERDVSAAVTIQKHARRRATHRQYSSVRKSITLLQAAVRGVSCRTHVLNFAKLRLKARSMRVKMAKWKLEAWASKLAHERMMKRAAATTLQKTWKMYIGVKRLSLMRHAVSRIQALVRGVQSRRYQFDFAVFRAKMDRTRMLIAAWTIAQWSKRQLMRYHQQRYDATVVLQTTIRKWFARRQFKMQKRAAVKIQARLRGWLSREQYLNFCVFKWRATESKRRIAVWCIQSWVVRCVQQHRRSYAATVIQKNVRRHVKRSRFMAARTATIKIQARFRGNLHREFVFDYGMFKTTQVRCQKKLAMWKLQEWILRVVRAERLKASSAVCIQANVRCFVARTQYNKMRYAAVQFQKIFRGMQSRRYKHDHTAFRVSMHRVRVLCAAWKIQTWVAGRVKLLKARRSALTKANWTRLSFHLLRSRLSAVDSIAKSWTSYKLRKTVVNRIEWTALCKSAASHIQWWWQGAHLQRAARLELQTLRCQRAKEMEREQAEDAATRILLAWRRSVRRSHATYRRQCLVKMKEFYAGARIGHAVFDKLIRGNREKRGYECSVRRLQSWWRGMLVRLHEKRQAVTEQRKKLATMTLVAPDHQSSLDKSQTEASSTHVHHSSQPLTLGARLEMALHMLLHGKRLQEMLFASHTIEMCTRYSRECAWKCVELKISNTIFAAIRGLNRSRPHVELLHQLLLVLVNLTTYKSKESKNLSSDKASPVDHDDLRAVDALVDLMHVHRDMHVIFVLASRVLKHYLLVLKPHTATSKEVFHQWSETHRRLRALYELLHKKMQVAAWTSRIPATPSKSSSAANAQAPNATNPNANVLAKINPKTAVSVMTQLLKVIE